MRYSAARPSVSSVDDFEALDVIGNGTFGLIRKVERKSDGRFFARKELKFERMSERDKKQIVAEVNILRNLRHENVVRYEERSIDPDKGILYIVMEYCGGGDLGSVIQKCRKTKTFLPDETVWSYLAQLTLALDACHYGGGLTAASISSASSRHSFGIPALGPEDGKENAILHRDLKPENVFLDTDGNIKLGDFGLSKQVGSLAFANTYVGTPYYMSPELATGQQYDAKADIWALGCIVYELCALIPPFDAADQAELTLKIKQGHVPALPRGYSSELADAVNAMLQLDPRRRPTTRQLLTLKQIRFACKTLDLAAMHRKMTAEKAKLKTKQADLEHLEAELVRKQSQIEQLQSQQVNADVQQELLDRIRNVEEREDTIRLMEEQMSKRQEKFEAQRKLCSDEWDRWYGGEKSVVLQEKRVMKARNKQLKAKVKDLENMCRKAGLDIDTIESTDKTVSPSSTEQPIANQEESASTFVQATAAIDSGIPTSQSAAIRLISNGRARFSNGDEDISMQSIRERVVAGETGPETQSSLHTKENEPEEQQSRRRTTTSNSTNEEGDNPEGGQEDVQDARPEETNSHTGHPKISGTEIPPRSSDLSNGGSVESNQPTQRPLLRTALNNLAWREQKGIDDSDFAMRTATDESNLGIRPSSDDSRDVFVSEPSSSDDHHSNPNKKLVLFQRMSNADGLSDPMSQIQLSESGTSQYQSRRRSLAQRNMTSLLSQRQQQPTSSTNPPISRPALRTKATIASQCGAVEIPGSPTAAQEEQRIIRSISSRALTALAAVASSSSSSSSSSSTSTSSTSSTQAVANTSEVNNDDPQWLQYDEDDRPSPFIKRITRLSEKTLSRVAPAPGLSNGTATFTFAAAADKNSINNHHHSNQTNNLLIKATLAAATAAATNDEYGRGFQVSNHPPQDEDTSMASLNSFIVPSLLSQPIPSSISSTSSSSSCITSSAVVTSSTFNPTNGVVDKENSIRARIAAAAARRRSVLPLPTSSVLYHPNGTNGGVASSSKSIQPLITTNLVNQHASTITELKKPSSATAVTVSSAMYRRPRRSSVLSRITVVPLNPTTTATPIDTTTTATATTTSSSSSSLLSGTNRRDR